MRRPIFVRFAIKYKTKKTTCRTTKVDIYISKDRLLRN
jgi:hypothetical protein